MQKDTLFGTFARRVSNATGSPLAFMMAVGVIAVWLLTGPLFGFSDTWQLVINTGTTIITFLMVFVIQHSQNKDTVALQLKIDELIRANEGADNSLMDLEDLSEAELRAAHQRFTVLANESRALLSSRDK